jgi:hypothetical protein
MNCSFYIVFINGISEWSLELRTSNFDHYGREARNVQEPRQTRVLLRSFMEGDELLIMNEETELW